MIRRCFAGFKHGDLVTGTVHYFGLNGPELERRGIVHRDAGNDWRFGRKEQQQ